MTGEHTKKSRKPSPTKGRIENARPTTPESATSLEKERLDDEAVEHAVTADENTTGTSHQILPGPPISPNEQKNLRETIVTSSGQSGAAAKTSLDKSRRDTR